jgi:pyruvate/2-oxoglutarate/acetoin dehydrogenase E1 component
MLASVRKTGRVLVLTEDCRTGSAAAEIIALVTDHAFDALKTAPVRITGEDVPLPYSQPLESCALPNSSKIAEVAKAMLGR